MFQLWVGSQEAELVSTETLQFSVLALLLVLISDSQRELQGMLCVANTPVFCVIKESPSFTWWVAVTC